MPCTGAYASAKDFADYWCIKLDDSEEAQLNRHLMLTAGRIHMARSSSAQCECSLADGAADYLMELNVLLTAAHFKCPCAKVSLTSEEKAALMTSIENILTAIRKSEIELCAGETGADYPYTGWANQGVNEIARTRIIASDYLRQS